jgi:hypothetical protein
MNMAGKPFWKTLYFQVLVAIALGILTGWLFPDFGRALKPLGDGFIKLVKMIITPVIFLTVVTGIAGMADLKAFGRVGAKAMAYFLTFSTLALIVGLVVGNVVRPGDGSTSIRQRSIRGGLHLCQQGQGAIGHRTSCSTSSPTPRSAPSPPARSCRCCSSRSCSESRSR